MLMSPLLVLVEHSHLLACMMPLGTSLISLTIYGWAGTCAFYLVHRKWCKAAIVFGSIFVVCGIIIAMPHSISPRPAWLDRIVHMPRCFSCGPSTLKRARTIAYEARQLMERFSDADVIIMPESAVVDADLFSCDECVTLLSVHHIKKAVHIIAGSFAYDEQRYYRNACYWVYDGHVCQRHDKRHTMPLTERIPSLCDYSFIRDFYFAQASQVAASARDRKPFIIGDTCVLMPYICSELFFNTWPESDNTRYPIVVIVNDSWCPALYIRRLLYYLARFKAMQWKRDIVYVSYYYAALCDATGGIHYLQSYDYT